MAPKLAAQLNIPSRSSRTDHGKILQGESLLGAWRQHLSQADINAGVAVLQAFGLERIYNDHALPLCEVKELLPNFRALGIEESRRVQGGCPSRKNLSLSGRKI